MYKEFDTTEILNELGITPAEAACFLKVDKKTIYRWCKNPLSIHGPAKNALLAWLKLHKLGLAWRPGEIDIICDNGGIRELPDADIKKVVEGVKENEFSRLYYLGSSYIEFYWRDDIEK